MYVEANHTIRMVLYALKTFSGINWCDTISRLISTPASCTIIPLNDALSMVTDIGY